MEGNDNSPATNAGEGRQPTTSQEPQPVESLHNEAPARTSEHGCLSEQSVTKVCEHGSDAEQSRAQAGGHTDPTGGRAVPVSSPGTTDRLLTVQRQLTVGVL